MTTPPKTAADAVSLELYNHPDGRCLMGKDGEIIIVSSPRYEAAKLALWHKERFRPKAGTPEREHYDKIENPALCAEIHAAWQETAEQWGVDPGY